LPDSKPVKTPAAEPETNLAQTPATAAWFKTTHWTVVLDARNREFPLAQDALAHLCRIYWRPIYSYLRRVGHSPEDAQDLTQEFFARFLQKDYLKAMQPEKGKFRGFLLMALNRFRANEWDRANRLKRGGGRQFISIDAPDTENRYRAEPVDNVSPEKAFEHSWAIALLEQVHSNLEAEFSAPDKAKLFQELKIFVSGEQEQTSYGQIAQKLNMTEGALRVAVHRLRQRYRELLRHEIANTVTSIEEIDDEIRHLFATLS
jgi:RNA polymerase sigma factor (sigma-70 family)